MKLVIIALFFSVIAIPIAMTLGDQTIDDAIRRGKVAVCNNSFTACTNQGSSRASSAPNSYSFCMEDCSRQYQSCMGNISRGAAARGAAGVTSHPSVAPPTPTPRKISPQRVTGVSTRPVRVGPNATATVSPAKSGDLQKQSRVSATATPRKN